MDFRQIYASVFEDWLGVNSTDVLGEPVDAFPVIA